MIRRNIPNAITCGNLLCGCLAIILAFEGNLMWAGYLVFIAAVFDFFDGLAARMLKAYSPIGKDLDSLADMVTFGIVPGMIMYKILAMVTTTFFTSDTYFGIELKTTYIPLFALIIPLFSAIRLAKFNVDQRQTDYFIGLPTPANAVLIASFPVIFEINLPFLTSAQVYSAGGIFFNPNNLCILIFMLCLLLVSEIRLFSFKFRNFRIRENLLRYVFLAVSALFLIILQTAAIPAIITSYIIISILYNYFASGDASKGGEERA